MGQDKLVLVAEEEASLSSGSLRLYALPYGCVDLYNYDPLNRRCAVGIMVANEYRRQGYALAMLQALETQYRDSLHTLYADIAETNQASIALYHLNEETGEYIVLWPTAQYSYSYANSAKNVVGNVIEN